MKIITVIAAILFWAGAAWGGASLVHWLAH